MPDPQRFRATLYAVGINRCVDVPARVSRALGGAARIPVRGAIGAVGFESTLTPRGHGRHRLFVHSRVWRTLGVDRGAAVTVTLEPATPRPVAVPPLPPDLRGVLGRRPLAARAFSALTPTLKREVIRWLTAAKRPDTRERRLEVGLERIEERYQRQRRP